MCHVSELFASQSVREVALTHALNDLPLPQAQQLFREIAHILRPDGKLIIEVEDIGQSIEAVVNSAAGDSDDHSDDIGRFHAFVGDTPTRQEGYLLKQMSWSREHLTKELKRAGFGVVEFMAPQIHAPPPGAPQRNMQVEATR
jgi:hypothetical protein